MNKKSPRGPLQAALQLLLPFFQTSTSPEPRERAPGGQRMSLLNNQPVHWELRRSRRRTIGFQIDHRGLRVSAPRWVTVREVEQALQEKSDWVLRKLVEWREHERRREGMAIRWEDGAPMRLLGQTLRLCIDPSTDGVIADGERLRVGLPPEASAEQIKDRVEAWLRAQAREVFAERIAVFTQRLGRAPTRWSLSSARTRWGSCNPDGSIRLNWRLIHFPREVIDYVVAHELAHLDELNHGPRFWNRVGELFPDYEHARAMLRQHYDDTPAS